MKKLLTILMLFLSTTASAVVTVSPVHLNILEGQRSTSLTIKNDSDQQKTVEVLVKNWVGQNADGTDQLADTSAVITSRPILIVPAHESTTIRLIIKSRSERAEDAYRVFVNDITPPQKSGKVSLTVNSVLPFFILNSKSAGQLELEKGRVKNVGNRHVRIANYTDKNGKQVDRLHYLFPNQSVKLPVDSIDQITWSDDVF